MNQSLIVSLVVLLPLIYMTRPRCGNMSWQDGIFSSICSIEDIHVFGCLDGKIYALNKEGNLSWQFVTGGEVWSSPSSDGHSIFVGSDDCSLYALDLDGNLLWKAKLNGKIRSSSPCISSDVQSYNDPVFPSLYIGTQSGILYRINKDTGTILWSSDLRSPLLSSPSSIQSLCLNRIHRRLHTLCKDYGRLFSLEV